jgi:hypothetical protein
MGSQNVVEAFPASGVHSTAVPHRTRIFIVHCTHSYVIRTIKSRSMRWARHVARMREKRNTYGVLMGKLEGK